MNFMKLPIMTKKQNRYADYCQGNSSQTVFAATGNTKLNLLNRSDCVIGEAMMISWAGYGIRIERQNETFDALEIYISVPEHSFHLNAYQEEMAGKLLAKRFKEVIQDMGIKRLIVRFRIRQGEYWTKEMADTAELDMRKSIYGSQF